MRRLIFLLFIPLLISCEQTSVEYIWLKPDAKEGKDALIQSFPEELQQSTSSVFMAEAKWDDQNEHQLISRSLLEFDLKSLPRNAKVLHAELRLFNGLRSDLLSNVNKLDLNECLLQRITESWDESSVTWVNQPQTTSENEIRIGPSTSDREDLSIDITELLIDLQRIENFGLMLKLVEESGTKRMAFASSDAFHSEFHSELLIEYEVKRALLAN
ncbi:DNRLRE domain-containing protein [Salibacteraceae bacterium]|jgi:hypothetical protein|nr:DNRLRE domain-containing protein [Salibacteraceae bacterium]